MCVREHYVCEEEGCVCVCVCVCVVCVSIMCARKKVCVGGRGG